MRFIRFLPVTAFCSLCQLGFAQQTYSFVSFDYPGATTTYCSGINSGGDVVGSFTNYSLNTVQAFRRNAEGQFFTLLGGKQAVASGINDSGVIVGSTIEQNTDKAGYVLSKGGVTPVGSPKYATQLTGISTNNSIVGSSRAAGGHLYGFEIVEGKTQQLPLLNGEPVVPFNINREGTIVVASGDYGYILANGSYQYIQYPGDVAPSAVYGINDSSVVVGSRTATGEAGGQGFTYFQGTFTDVVYPGSFSTVPVGISNLGAIVGVYQDATEAVHCFIATPAH